MKPLGIPYFRKHSTFFKAALIGGMLGLLYALESDAGIDYGKLRFVPGIVIGTALGFMAVLSERILAKTASLPFWAALMLKTILYSLGIAFFLLLSVLVFGKWLGSQSYAQAASDYIDYRLMRDVASSLLPIALSDFWSHRLASHFLLVDVSFGIPSPATLRYTVLVGAFQKECQPKTVL